MRFSARTAPAKSTLMKVLIGVYSADSGRIVLDGEDVTGLSLRERRRPRRRDDLPGTERPAESFGGGEPVRPARAARPRVAGRHAADDRADARALIERYGFELDAAARAGDLGFAQRQMVEILKALSRGAKLLVMDEPTSSLTVREEETLFAIGGPAQGLRHRRRLYQPSHGGRAASLRPDLDRQGRAPDRAAACRARPRSPTSPR